MEIDAHEVKRKVHNMAWEGDNPLASLYSMKFIAAELKDEPIEPIAEELVAMVQSLFSDLAEIATKMGLSSEA